MRNIVKRGIALGLSLMLGIAGSLGIATGFSCSALTVNAADMSGSEKSTAGGIDIFRANRYWRQ